MHAVLHGEYGLWKIYGTPLNQVSGKLCGGWGRVTELASYYIYVPGLYVENKVPLARLFVAFQDTRCVNFL